MFNKKIYGKSFSTVLKKISHLYGTSFFVNMATFSISAMMAEDNSRMDLLSDFDLLGIKGEEQEASFLVTESSSKCS